MKKIRHGHTVGGRKSPTYGSWLAMKSRCHNPHDEGYKLYSGKGIKVCKRWMKFENFLEDMGERPKGLTLERKNNDEGYKPSNCKWATPKEQGLNRRDTRWIAFREENFCIADWAAKMGIGESTLRYRLNMFPLEKAMTMPKFFRGDTARSKHE